jgi:parallel beta-helix repeat protein
MQQKTNLKTILVAGLFILAGGGAIALPTEAISNSISLETAQVPIGANTLYVNPQTGSDSSNAGSNAATPYKTISYAIAQAQSGTIIQLAPGSYTADTGEVFPITLRQGVTLHGDESSKGQTVVIIGGGQYLSPTFSRQSATIVALDDSEIRGVTITNPTKRGTGVWVESTNPTIENNIFTHNKRDGVFVTGTADPKIKNNIFRENDANGISVARSAKGEIRGNLFVNTGFGIAIGGTSTPAIADNRILQNTDGIYINDSARPVLRNNLIENNVRDGVIVTINAQPDLGTADNPGNNLIRGNGKFDLNNATRTNTISAVGNDINRSRIAGRVEFVAAQVRPPSGGSGTFADIEGHWAKPYIEALAAKGIISGFSDGTFRPREPVNRAQFAVIINKAFSPNPVRPAVNFTDVRNNFWAFRDIQAAFRGGYLSGDGRLFRPGQEITRIQAIVSLASGLRLPPGENSVLSLYKDAAQVPNYAIAPLAAATKQQLVVNFPQQNQLNPNQVATRADIAAFVYQALVSAGKAEAIASPYIVRVSQTTQP